MDMCTGMRKKERKSKMIIKRRNEEKINTFFSKTERNLNQIDWNKVEK
jgi:hypothetical protein